jgi:tRNA (guanine-N7-)-methyltransferase
MSDKQTEQQHKSIEQAKAEGKYIRTIKSFVKREGRLTKGQQAALDAHWSTMGLEHENGLIDTTEIFGNDNPVVLEIGFGMGASLVEMAKNAPEKNFIGIEVHLPGVGACVAAAHEAGVTNLRVYEHDAVEILRDCIPDETLSTVQLFFPDPSTRKSTINVVLFNLNSYKSLEVNSRMVVFSIWQQTGKTMLSI